MQPDALKRLRVLEGVGVEREAQPAGIPAVMQRRILGEVPIEKDGSFNIEVPSDTPIELQVLDADGMALRSCGWIWVKDHARQGCIGCHEDPELTPENFMVDAVKRASAEVAPAVAERRTVDFQRDVMPIVSGKCIQCHGDASELSLVGSANIDTRSFRFNFEANVFVRDEALNRSLSDLFEHDQSSSIVVRLAQLESRPWSSRVAEAAVQLLSPLL